MTEDLGDGYLLGLPEDQRDELTRVNAAADAALRLATRHHLPWQELDALRAHAALDHTEGIDRGRAAKAEALHGRLVPPGLDPTRRPLSRNG
jgi:hypothetical protein